MAEVIERKNFSIEEVNAIIKEFPLELLGNRVLITVNSEIATELTVADNTLAEEQYVIAVGPMAERFVKSGDTVILDMPKLMKKRQVPHDQTQVEEVLDLKPFQVGDHTFAEINDQQIRARYKNV